MKLQKNNLKRKFFYIINLLIIQVFLLYNLAFAESLKAESNFLSPSLQIGVPNFLTVFDRYNQNNTDNIDSYSLFEQKKLQAGLIKKIISEIEKSDKFTSADLEIVKKFIKIAESNYGESTFSSEPNEYYFNHVLEVTEILLRPDLKLNPSMDTVCAGLLHRMPDTRIWQSLMAAGIEDVLIDEIVSLKNKFLNLTDFSYTKMNLKKDRHTLNNFMNNIIQQSEDDLGQAAPNIIKLVLADKLASIRFASEVDRDTLVKDIADVYAPLAHRIGAQKLKDKLYNESFRLARPAEYKQTLKLVEAFLGKDYFELDADLQVLEEKLKRFIKDNFRVDFTIDVMVRVKGLYEIYEKFRDRESLNDVLGIRIICDCSAAELYQFSDVVQQIVGTWDPKLYDQKFENGLQSGMIFVDVGSVDSYDGNPYEVQILNRQSHEKREREFPHWSYKLAQRTGQVFDTEEYVPIGDFDDDFKRVFDGLKDSVFPIALGANGELEIKRLAAGSVPADLAAARLVNRLNEDYKGAKVSQWKNGLLLNTQDVAMDYQIKSKDIVEIVSAQGYLKNDINKRTNLRKSVKGFRTQLLLALMDLGVSPDSSKITSGEIRLKEQFDLRGIKITSKVVEEFLTPFAISLGLADVKELYLALTYYNQQVSVGEVIEAAKESGIKIIKDNFSADDFMLGQIAKKGSLEEFFVRVGAGEITIKDIKAKIKDLKNGIKTDIKNVRFDKEYKFKLTIPRHTKRSSKERLNQQMITTRVKNINEIIKSLGLEVVGGEVKSPVSKGNGSIKIQFSVLHDDIFQINELVKKFKNSQKVKIDTIGFNETVGRKFVVEFFNQGQKLTSLIEYLENIISQESNSTQTIELDVKKQPLDQVKDGIIEITTTLPSGLDKKAITTILERIEKDRIAHQATRNGLGPQAQKKHIPELMRMLQFSI
ncbi:MAG: HD domain-containing protein [Candidatus Omnitrophica bacterium]|nr:HD domain-containing protein [Candidatus Omnitrophota bacterium]